MSSIFKTSNVDNCKVLTLERHHHRNGNLSVVENGGVLPFDVKRIFYIYDIPGGEERASHAHYELYEFIVAVSGSFDIELFDGKEHKTVTLNRPYNGLLLVPGIWTRLTNFSSGAVALVMASEEYIDADYIRDVDEYMAKKQEK